MAKTHGVLAILSATELKEGLCSQKNKNFHLKGLKNFLLKRANSHLQKLTSTEKEGSNENGLTASANLNPIALRTAKTLWSFGCSECNRVNRKEITLQHSQIQKRKKYKNVYADTCQNVNKPISSPSVLR